MSWVKRVVGSRSFQQVAGTAAAEYLRLVWKTTNPFVLEPATIYEQFDRDVPAIIAMWHGQHFLVPFIRRNYRAKVLVSRHRDGEINAIAAERLGVGTIRGSGHHSDGFLGKGGVSAFREMLVALEQGYNVALTADVPKIARVAGLGIVKLASVSGRPIYPIAIATRRRFELDNWDRSAVNLPFGRGAGVTGAPLWVAADADSAALETARASLEASLNAATVRAYAIADQRQQDARV